MAGVKLQNVREHDITLCTRVNKAGDIVSHTIPGARQNPDEKSQMIPGVAVVDEEFIAIARKNSRVCDHYFNAGWLTEADDDAEITPVLTAPANEE